MKAFISVNYIMAVSQLSSIPLYWDCDHFIGNVDIQNIFMRIKHQDLEVLQNLHLADNTKQGQTDKGCKIRPTSNHLNESLQALFSNEPGKSIDEDTTNFKGHSSMRRTWKWNP